GLDLILFVNERLVLYMLDPEPIFQSVRPDELLTALADPHPLVPPIQSRIVAFDVGVVSQAERRPAAATALLRHVALGELQRDRLGEVLRHPFPGLLRRGRDVQSAT